MSWRISLWERWEEISTPRLAITSTARRVGGWSSTVQVPAEVSSYIEDVHLPGAGVEEDEEVMAQKLHLLYSLFFIHGPHWKALGSHDVGRLLFLRKGEPLF